MQRRVYPIALRNPRRAPATSLARGVDREHPCSWSNVPEWLPLRIDWVYLTGAGHIAAGLAILLGVMPRLAAALEAAQITAFVILAHIPAVWNAPRDRIQWAMLVYAAAIAASAWLVTAALGDGPIDGAQSDPRRGRV
jgi:uncharacterized membrane protein